MNTIDKKAIDLINQSKELQFKDFQRVLNLSEIGIRKKIIDFIKLDWIKVKDKSKITYIYVKGDNLPEVEG